LLKVFYNTVSKIVKSLIIIIIESYTEYNEKKYKNTGKNA